MREEITNLYELSDGWEDSDDEGRPAHKAAQKVCVIHTNPKLDNYDYYELNVIKHHLLSQSRHGLLYFDLVVKGQKVRAMLDSGSSRDIIDVKLQKSLCLKATRIPEFSLGMADDTPIACNSIVKDITIRFVSKDTKPFKDNITLSVIDLKGKFDIILGQEFLVRRNPQIDWRDRSMTFFNNHIVKATDRQVAITSMRKCLAKPPLAIPENGPTKINKTVDFQTQDSALNDSRDIEMNDSRDVERNHDIIDRELSNKHNNDHNFKDEDTSDGDTSIPELVNDSDSDSDDDDTSDEWLSSVRNRKTNVRKFPVRTHGNNDNDVSMQEQVSDHHNHESSHDDDDIADVISASEMKNHLKSLRHKFPGIQCALAIVNVPTEEQVAVMETQTGVSTTTVNLPTEFNIGDWICNVEDTWASDQDKRKTDRLKKLRRKVEERFSKAKMADGTPLMTDKLPPGIPEVRFERDGEIQIETDPAEKPPASGPIPLSVDQLKELQKQMEYYVPRGFWRPSSSPYAAPILFAPKVRDDGQFDGWRLCVDYRKLNAITKQDKFPLPNPETLIAQLSGAKYFSKLDLTQFFHQIPMKPEDIPKTAMVSRYGSYEWTVMPFGLVNAPAVSVRFGARVFHDFLDKFMVIFIDDLLVYSKTVEEHLHHLEMILRRLLQHKLYLKPGKCHFFATAVNYLGLGISDKGIFIEDHRKKAILDWPVPNAPTSTLQSRAKAGRQTRNRDGKTGIRSFLGVVGFFRKFIKGYASKAAALTDVLKAEHEFFWGEEQQKSFDLLKKAITDSDVLQIPSSDPKHDIILQPDCSKAAAGAVFLQNQGQGYKPCAFISKRLSDAQAKWGPYELELFALTYMLKQWRPYLLGRVFTVKTDHSPLTYYHSQERLTDKLVRQLDFISEFRFQCLHIPGKDQTAADGLSRRPDHYLEADGSERSLIGKTIMQDVADTLEEPKITTLVSSREYCEYIQRRLTLKLEQYRARQAARKQLTTESAVSVIKEYAGQHHLPIETESLIILDEDIAMMHEVGMSDPAENKGIGVKEIFDNLTIMHSEILLSLMVSDQNIIKEIKRAYKTDDISKAVIADPSAKSDKYQIIGGLIYGLKRDGGKALYIPATAKLGDSTGKTWNMRDLLCYECHDSPIAGHIGVSRMSALLRRSFIWPGMKDNIVKQVRECYDCQQNKASHGRVQGMYTPLIPPIRRWSEVSLDFITDLPVTTVGKYDAILVVQDSTSRMIHLIPFCMTYGAVETANLYFKEVFRLHGLPDRIVSDRDTRFTSSFWQQLWKRCGTKLAMSTSYHPQSNAPNERSHKVIEELLRSLVQYPPTDWDQQLPIIEFAVNNAVVGELGYSPLELSTGEAPLDPSTLLFPIPEVGTQKSVQELLIRQSEILKRSRTQLIAARQLVADRVNANRIQPRFKAGSRVMLKSKHLNWPGVDLLGKHLKPPKIGPFKVIRLNKSNTAVELEFDHETKVHPVQPVSRCELFVEDTRDRAVKLIPPRTFTEEGEEYGEIERIVGKKVRRQHAYYLVKWKGFPSRFNTWEARQHLLNEGCKESIDEYEQRIANLI